MSDKWVVLDAMGVVFEVGDDTNDLLVPYIRERNPLVTTERINELYLEASLGRTTSCDLWEGVGLGDQFPLIEEHYLSTCLTLDPGFRAAAEDLGKDHSLALLSNDLREWSAYLRASLDLHTYFRAAIISAEVGHRKPAKEIYEILLGKIGCVACDCVFVDDRAKNLRPARDLGLKTIHFIRDDAEPDPQANAAIRNFAELPEAVRHVLG